MSTSAEKFNQAASTSTMSRLQAEAGGGKRTVRIRDDAKGHDYGKNDPQNRGPHFNDEKGNHYDY